VHPNEELVRGVYSAFAEGDMDALRHAFADDIIFRIPGTSPVAGEYRGRDAVFGYLGKVMERSGETFSFEVHDVIANDEHAVGLMIYRGTRNLIQTTFRSVHVWHAQDGQATELWEYPEQPAFDEFWG
jgi:hypothetical protein